MLADKLKSTGQGSLSNLVAVSGSHRHTPQVVLPSTYLGHRLTMAGSMEHVGVLPQRSQRLLPFAG